MGRATGDRAVLNGPHKQLMPFPGISNPSLKSVGKEGVVRRQLADITNRPPITPLVTPNGKSVPQGTPAGVRTALRNITNDAETPAGARTALRNITNNADVQSRKPLSSVPGNSKGTKGEAKSREQPPDVKKAELRARAAEYAEEGIEYVHMDGMSQERLEAELREAEIEARVKLVLSYPFHLPLPGASAWYEGSGKEQSAAAEPGGGLTEDRECGWAPMELLPDCHPASPPEHQSDDEPRLPAGCEFELDLSDIDRFLQPLPCELEDNWDAGGAHESDSQATGGASGGS